MHLPPNLRALSSLSLALARALMLETAGHIWRGLHLAGTELDEARRSRM
ncbi:MAG TPA: hypothetical protein VGJ60_15360 [Chloroflexota bacterium]